MKDYNTRNLSFIEMSQYLKSCGVKNHDFMLNLIDKDLSGIDPYDPDILYKYEIMKKIISECKNNIWYYLREVLKVPAMGGGSIPFKLDKANCAQTFCFINDRSSWKCQSRQTFSTGSILTLLNYNQMFSDPNLVSVISTHKSDSIRICNRMEDQLHSLPEYIYNQAAFSNTFVKSSITPTDKTSADFIGRSFSDDEIVYYNDAEFIKFIDIILDSNLSFRKEHKQKLLFDSVISDNAKENGALNIINNSILWDESFYDKLPLDEDIIIYIKYDYESLGLKEDYLNRMKLSLNNDEELIRREILLKRRL